MKALKLVIGLAMLQALCGLSAQITSDALGMHSFGPGTKSPVVGARPDACAYCHAPHSGLNSGLWNQKLTTQNYSLYTSDTQTNLMRQPTLGLSSNHCLSCHDGSVATGTTVAYGTVITHGTMNSADVFGSNLAASHPFSMVTPLKDNVDIASSIVANGKTLDSTGKVKLIKGNVECLSCHNPHVQSKDLISQNFLVKDSSSGAMCLSCHDPTRTMSGKVNPIADWTLSAHALSTAKISTSAGLGSYTTVATTACNGCHAPHNAASGARILRGSNEQDCIACHNGSNVSPMPQYANVFAEYATPKYTHPVPSSNNLHDAAEATLLDNNRHATCSDCHNGHSAQVVGSFPVAPTLRASQKDIAGISASDGTTVLNPAINQYENCLRCHGNSTGKQTLSAYGYSPVRVLSSGDPLNMIPQFVATATSSHPVMHARNSTLNQASLRSYMMNLDGVTQGRSMGTQILCSDCHNSDDNREFGGTGANGPHGSKYAHIVERRYEFGQAATPGGTVTNLFPNPDTSSTGPFALCAKCHDLGVVISNSSWSGHVNHVGTDGLNCSICHTSHGNGATSSNISGQRLVNFDANVVAQNNGAPITYNYNGGNNTCTLVCHNATHNADGTVTSNARRMTKTKK